MSDLIEIGDQVIGIKFPFIGFVGMVRCMGRLIIDLDVTISPSGIWLNETIAVEKEFFERLEP